MTVTIAGDPVLVWIPYVKHFNHQKRALLIISSMCVAIFLHSLIPVPHRHTSYLMEQSVDLGPFVFNDLAL